MVRQPKRNKLSPAFNVHPYTVTNIKGTMIMAKNLSTQHRITRNISFFKMLPRKGNYKQYENSADNDADDNESIDLRPRERQVARRYPVRKRGRPNYFHEER